MTWLPPGCRDNSPPPFVRPEPPVAVQRCLRLADEGRIEEARAAWNAIQPGDATEAWRAFAGSRIDLAGGAFDLAEARARKAAALTLQAAADADAQPQALQLLGASLEALGTALRRQDRYEQARQIHLAAYSVRRDCGHPTAQSESALSVAVCNHWLGRCDQALRWYLEATRYDAADESAARQKHFALNRLGDFLAAKGDFVGAVEAIRSACAVVEQFVPGELQTVLARVPLAQAIIRLAETPAESENADRLVCEAESILLGARSELPAYGQTTADDLILIDQQLDFAARLRHSLGKPDAAANPLIE